MHIQRIDDNKLEIFIDQKDLTKNHLSAEDFMASSLCSNKFLFGIIKHASIRTNFNLQNYKILLEKFSIPSIQSFILIITRIPFKIYSSVNKKYKINVNFFIRFSDFNALCDFCNSLDLKVYSNLLYINDFYYLNLQVKRLLDFNKITILLKEFVKDYKINIFLNENANLIIKNNAIEFCKNFVV